MTAKALNTAVLACGAAVSMTLAVVVMGSSFSQASTTSSTGPGEVAKTPGPNPKGKMKLVKTGSELTLTKEQQGRQEPNPTGEANKPQHSETDSKIRTPAASKPVVPFRINIRPCGIPTDEMLTGGEVCPPDPPEEDAVRPTPSMAVRRELPRPEDVTWEQVLSETKNVAFPGLRVVVQPAGKTLVNLDTIVYTDQAKVSSTTVTLLGFPVLVEATPMSYTWRFGDGATVTTESPGKPYPAKEITHKYLKRASLGITLTTNYAARFNVDGTGWQYIAGTVPITGPATPLQVQEAVPVLVEPPN